jgi:hypothetical protein
MKLRAADFNGMGDPRMRGDPPMRALNTNSDTA